MGISKTSRTPEPLKVLRQFDWNKTVENLIKKYQIILHEAKFQGKDVNLPAFMCISITTGVRKLALRQNPFNTFLLKVLESV